MSYILWGAKVNVKKKKMMRPELYSWKQLRLSVSDKPVQTFLFTEKIIFRILLFILSCQMKAWSQIPWLRKKEMCIVQSSDLKIWDRKSLGTSYCYNLTAKHKLHYGARNWRGSSSECQGQLSKVRSFKYCYHLSITEVRKSLHIDKKSRQQSTALTQALFQYYLYFHYKVQFQ